MKRHYLILSDLHGHLPNITYPKIFDALLIAGDIAPDGTKEWQEGWMFNEFLRWAESFNKVFYIAGNHDFWEDCPTSDKLVYLKDSFDEEHSIWGSPYILPIWGNYQKTEEELEEIYKHIPKQTKIILSHAPPYGILDSCEHFFDPRYIENAGSKSLLRVIEELEPSIVICGHIHEHGGKSMYYKKTKVINAAKKQIFLSV